MSSFLPNADLTARAIRDAYPHGEVHVSRSEAYTIWKQHRRSHRVRSRTAAALRRIAATLEPVDPPVTQCGAVG